MKITMRIGVSALLVAAAGSCGDAGGQATPDAEGESPCRNICAKQEQCDSKTDEQDCVEECEAQTGYSAAYSAVVERCYQKASCDEIETELADCVELGIKQLDPTAAGESLCGELATKAEACNGEVDENEVEQACLDLAVTFSDRLIGDSEACLAEACDEVKDCLKELEDEYQTDDVEDLFDGIASMGSGGSGGSGGSSPGGSSGSGGSSPGGSGGTSSPPVSGTIWLQPTDGHVANEALGIQGWWWTTPDGNSSILPADFSAAGSEICATGQIAAADVGTERFGAVVGLNLNQAAGADPQPYAFESHGISAFVVKVSGSAVPAKVRVSVATAANAIYCKEISTISTVGVGATVALDEFVLNCWDASSTSHFSGSANAVRVDLPPAATAQSFDVCMELAVVVP